MKQCVRRLDFHRKQFFHCNCTKSCSETETLHARPGIQDFRFEILKLLDYKDTLIFYSTIAVRISENWMKAFFQLGFNSKIFRILGENETRHARLSTQRNGFIASPLVHSVSLANFLFNDRGPENKKWKNTFQIETNFYKNISSQSTKSLDPTNEISG